MEAPDDHYWWTDLSLVSLGGKFLYLAQNQALVIPREILTRLQFFGYPSNPAEAKFLTIEEKIQVIRRVQASHQGSIEQKQFKKSQFIETLKDPVSWLFCLQAFTLMYGNNLTYGQKNLLTISVGIDQFGSTLVSVAGGSFSIVNCLVATYALRRWPTNIAFHAAPWCILAAIGGIGSKYSPQSR